MSGRLKSLVKSLVITLTAGLAVAVLPGQAAVAAPANQVTDGTFDSGTGTWWTGGDAGNLRTSSGQLCTDVAGGSSVNYLAMLGRGGFTLAAGRTYALTFDMRSTIAYSPVVRVQQEASPFTGTLDTPIQVDAGLRRYALPFTSSLGRSDIQIAFLLGGHPDASTACIDNVRLVETDEIANGSFTGTINPWWKTQASTAIALENNALRITTSAGKTNPWDDVVGTTGVTLRAGKQYVASFTASASTARSARVIVQTAASPYTSPLARDVALTTSPQRFSFRFTSTLTTEAGQLTFQVGAANTAVVRVDEVSLIEQQVTAFDPVLYWNGVLVDAFRSPAEADRNPTRLSRAGAMLQVAVHDALASATGVGTPYTSRITIPQDTVVANPEAAANRAAHDVLKAVFPAKDFAANLTTAQSRIPNGATDVESQRGSSVGAQVAAAVIAGRTGDGSANNAAYTPSTTAGAWRPTVTGAAAVSPNWGLVDPFVMTSGAQFRPGLPGGFTSYSALLASPAYGAQVNEVKKFGRYDAPLADRSAEQTEIAFFWANDVLGTYKPPGQMFEHTRIVSQMRGLGMLENARLFGLMSLALADAAIAAWDAKYQTAIDLWRPETAIQRAGEDGRSETVQDTTWKPLSNEKGVRFSPSFPAYVSGHATFGGAWAAVMKGYFGTDSLTMKLTTDDPDAKGVVRTFTSFSQAALENGRSRIYLGVHYQWDADSGYATGTKVGNLVIANALRP
ncbi:carbohydrate binding domain-containing protein [Actinoplanes sp. NPDC023714]|uniref:carbohydrate binding domain-containing protein n=1 Tax=Actinoplanes sp. NPDC023714 TaxID=3154322 RepID=UPI0033D9B4A6